ncbi:MAG: lactate racemase domain-containing protein [Termitinemataceae bacterium]|nr:MAG: lactate racemase domain-containing protein [Termitinemataceae bacterium]
MEKTFSLLQTDKNHFAESEISDFFKGVLSYALNLYGQKKILVVVPDITRQYSFANIFANLCLQKMKNKIKAIMPALGTHRMMSGAEIKKMYPDIPVELFVEHDWRKNTTRLGTIENDFVENITEGAFRDDIGISVNKMLPDPDLSLIVSIGQVVPHEVFGMSNHTKNIFVGCGAKETIDKSHFASAAYGIEKILGKTNNPIRGIFDEAYSRFSAKMPPVLWVMTVTDGTALSAVFAGFDRRCFEEAAEYSAKINITKLQNKQKKIVVYLDPVQYRSTWIANKAIYRTRMAIANGGELVIIAPGLQICGEDSTCDSVIRNYGYANADFIRQNAYTIPDLKNNLSAAAHMIHSSSENRFTIRYCTSNKMSSAYIESLGFKWCGIEEANKIYDPLTLKNGLNISKEGEEFFFINNPSSGLWM